MTQINHFTYHVPNGTLVDPKLSDFMALLGLAEIPPLDSYEHGWDVRWFRAPMPLQEDARVQVHLVEGSPQFHASGLHDQLSLGHFCVVIPADTMPRVTNIALRERWLERDSGSGRIWLRFHNLRVEVRPDVK